MEHGLPYYKNSTEFATTWDLVQKNLHCCGVENYTDWDGIINGTAVPDSCCIGGQEEKCGGEYNPDKPEEDIYTEGCFSVFSQEFKDNLNIVGGMLKFIVSKTTYELVLFGFCPFTESSEQMLSWISF